MVQGGITAHKTREDERMKLKSFLFIGILLLFIAAPVICTA
jgi:hypothetical protein